MIVGVGVVGVGFADAVGTTAWADGADAEGLGERVGLADVVVGGGALRAEDASKVGELTAGETGPAVAESAAGGVADADATPALAGMLAATELAGAGFSAACLVDVEHAASAPRAATASTMLTRRPGPVRWGMPHADTPTLARPVRHPPRVGSTVIATRPRTAAMTSGDLPSMQQLLQQASQMQQQLMSAQEDLARERVVGDSGGGLVSATVTGGGELVALRIDPSVADPEDTETLADLVLAAVRAATGRAAALQAAKLGPLTQGFGGLGQLGGLGGQDDGGLGGLPGGLPGLGL